ncbi:MAG: hypothetical protein AAGG75_08885 [Bacteroidota bacterium]
MKTEKSKSKIGYIALVSGALTLLLFAIQPYLLDLIEPVKSLGQIIGENARELIERLQDEEVRLDASTSRRQRWSNILTVAAFALLVFSVTFSLNALAQGVKKTYGIGGIALSLLGLAIYFSHLAIGLIAFIVIAILVVGLVLSLGG